MASADSILVTGARGFIGSHVVAWARGRGLRTNAGYRGARGPGVIHLDVCDAANVHAAFEKVAPALVVHCAAYGVNYAEQDLNRALAVNVRGSLNVLEAAARCGTRRFVHLGSCFEYGSHAGFIREDAALNPSAIYGATKAAATLLMRERAAALGVPLIVARPFGTWGPGEAAHRIAPQVLTACLTRSTLDLTACDVLRDYTYVEDMAACIGSLLLVSDIAPEVVVNVGSGEQVVLRDFVLAIARMFDAESLMRFGARAHRPTEMASVVADVSRLRELMGVIPKTPFAEGVRRTMAHMRRS
jgi:nucleoside-diphosphate-sugar epimerase